MCDGLLPKDYTEKLQETILPEGFIEDGFITTEMQKTDYSHEDYLLELLNQSTWFMRKTNGQKLEKPESESDGECDAASPAYSLDFKRVLGQSMQYVKSQTSFQIDTNGKGRTIYRISKGSGEYRGYWLHRLLRRYSVDDLKRIQKSGATNDGEKDIASLLRTILKDKNLLLLYPVVFDYQGSGKCTAQSICEAMYEDYKGILLIRKETFPERDTFMAFFYDNDLQIALYNDSRLKWIDGVRAMSSPTFRWIADFYWTDPAMKLFQ